MSGWTALLLAGSRPGGDPFAAAHGVVAKALIPIAGEAMIRRPLAALLASREIERVRVLAQHPQLLASVIDSDPRISLELSGATIAMTIEAIAADPETRWPLLVTTADHALLTPAMIADFCGRAAGADVAIGLVERRALDNRLPHTRRTWIGFRGGAYSGANLFALGSPRSARAINLWREVEQDRKKRWKLLAALGLPGLLGLGRIRTLDQTINAMGRRLHLNLRAVELADPLAAVDVDKPADLDLVEAIIAGRA